MGTSMSRVSRLRNGSPSPSPSPSPSASASSTPASKRSWRKRTRSRSKADKISAPTKIGGGAETFQTFDSNGSPKAKFRSDQNFPAPVANGIMAYTRKGEVDRQLLQHDILKYCFAGLYHAPVVEQLNKEGARVLDMGCGAGCWVVDMAREFPKAKCTGLDVLPVAVDETFPPNCEFLVCNIIDEFLPYDDNTFDFVVIRNMIFSLKSDEWRMFMSEAFRVTKRGGFVEIIENDIRAKRSGPLASKWIEKVAIAMTARDCDPMIFKKLERLMAAHGLDAISQDYQSVPIGRWGNEIGDMVRNDFVGICKTLKQWALIALGLSSEKYDELVTGIEEEMDRHEGYYNWYWAVGRKPPIEDLL